MAQTYRLKLSKSSYPTIDSLNISKTTTFRRILPNKATPKKRKKDF